MRFTYSFAPFLGVTCALAACSSYVENQTPASAINHSDSDIIGGTTEARPIYDGVFFLVMNNNELCTGSLISPRVIVTAKHCILNSTPKTTVASAGNSIVQGTRYANITEIRTTAGADIEGKDIALLLLDKSGLTKPFEWVQAPPQLIGTNVTLVGFGQQQVGPSGQGPAGIKESTTSSIIANSATEFAVTGPSTCFGDSGGPAFLADGRLVGVVSRGQVDCQGSSVLTRVDTFKDLISKAITDTSEATTASPPDSVSGSVSNPGPSSSTAPTSTTKIQPPIEETETSNDPTTEAVTPLNSRAKPLAPFKGSACQITRSPSQGSSLYALFLWVFGIPLMRQLLRLVKQ